jgi:protein-tyrosine phosphatase
LEDELRAWKRAGIKGIVSLLTPEEERDLELTSEARVARAQGLEFLTLPVEDRGVPDSEAQVRTTVDKVNRFLSAGENVVVHCRQGVGRTGLLAACLLISQGIAPDTAVAKLSAARGVLVPETPEQRHWIDTFATVSTGAKEG